jgi:hypothetical protein
MVSVVFATFNVFNMGPPEDIHCAPMFNMGLYVKNFQLVFKQNYSSQLKTNYIFVKLVKNTTILVQNVPSKCSPLGLWTAARLCAKNNKIAVAC